MSPTSLVQIERRIKRTSRAKHPKSDRIIGCKAVQYPPAPVLLFAYKHTVLALRVITLRVQAYSACSTSQYKHTVLALRVIF